MSDQSLTFQTLYAELLERCSLETFQRDFPPGGNFYSQQIKGRTYWYYQKREPGHPGVPKRYVGPDNEQIRDLIARHQDVSEAYKERRRIVQALKKGGFAGPSPLAGRVLESLAEAGVFRLRGVLVGTLAFQTYGPMLGARFRSSGLMTHDLDLAQFASVSVAIEDQLDVPFLDVLRRVDEAFEPALDLSHGREPPTRFVLRRGGEEFRVDVLGPNRGPDEPGPMNLPALRVSGEKLRFLDYLIHEEMKAVSLYGGGVLINVPAPERFALHKLIVSRRRHDTMDGRAKARKDLHQASELIAVLAEDDPYALKDAWEELQERGPTWRELSLQGARLLHADVKNALARAVGVDFHQVVEDARLDEGVGDDEDDGPRP